MPYRGKDGLARDIAKLRVEYGLMADIMKPHWRRWRRRPWDTHAYVNLWVESRRASPYLTGHVDCCLNTGLILYIIWEIVGNG